MGVEGGEHGSGERPFCRKQETFVPCLGPLAARVTRLKLGVVPFVLQECPADVIGSDLGKQESQASFHSGLLVSWSLC